jgi:hypothetical protein
MDVRGQRLAVNGVTADFGSETHKPRGAYPSLPAATMF